MKFRRDRLPTIPLGERFGFESPSVAGNAGSLNAIQRINRDNIRVLPQRGVPPIEPSVWPYVASHSIEPGARRALRDTMDSAFTCQSESPFN